MFLNILLSSLYLIFNYIFVSKSLNHNNLKYFLSITFLSLIIVGSTVAQDFTRIESEAGIDHMHLDEHIMGGGAAFFDYNNDGLLDLYITGGDEMDKLYENIGASVFVDVSLNAGFLITDSVKTTGVCTGDIDNDGDRDIFVATNEDNACLLFENLGDGTFSNISVSAGIIDTTWSTSITMGDYNMDGYLDIFVGNYVELLGLPNLPFYDQIDEAIPNYLYINNGDNTFELNTTIMGLNSVGATLAVAFTDYDNDNNIDIYVANDFGGAYDPNIMYNNNYPSNSFTDVGETTNTDVSINAMGIAIGDFDEEMNLDYYVSNMSGNKMLANNDENIFTELASATNTLCSDFVSWGNFFFDYNNDTYLDLFVANGGVLMQNQFREQANTLFEGQSTLIFDESIDFTGQVDSSISRGAIYGDIDNDGDLDIFIANMNVDSSGTVGAFLMRNNTNNDLNWIKIRTEGTTNNFDGFGTKVKMYVDGRSFIREVDGGSSYQSQNSSIVHFGLGESTVIDSMEIIWLGGEMQTLYEVGSNQQIHIKEGNVYNSSAQTICAGDSINFNDEWVSMEGTYYDTAISSLETDSVIFLSLSTITAYYLETELTINSGDSILLEGEYQTTEGIYTDLFTSSGGCDSTVVTSLSIDFSSGINEINSANWALYPNPSNGSFTIDLKDRIFINEISIYSILGTQVRKELVNSTIDKMEFRLEDQPDGIYFVTIRSNSETFTLRLILN